MKNIQEIVIDRVTGIINMMVELYPGIYIHEYRVSKDLFEDEYIMRGSAKVDKVSIGFYFNLFVGASKREFSYALNNGIKPDFKKKTDRIIKNAKEVKNAN